jgi:hypothetical protein
MRKYGEPSFIFRVTACYLKISGIRFEAFARCENSKRIWMKKASHLFALVFDFLEFGVDHIFPAL